MNEHISTTEGAVGRQNLRYHVAVVAALIAATSLVSCARTMSDDKNSTTHVKSSDSSDRLALVFQRINGDMVERSAAQLVAHHHYQDAIVRCVADSGAGFEYTSTMFVNPWEGITDTPSHGASLWLQPLGRPLGISVDMLSPADDKLENLMTEPGESGSELSSLSDEQEALLNQCADESGSDFILQPPAYRHLYDSLNTLVYSVESELPTSETARYAECLAATGFAARDPDALRELVTAPLVAAYPSRPGGADEDADVWGTAVDFEREAARADAVCRSEIMDSMMPRVDTELTTWLTQHHDELSIMDEQWDSLVADARNYPEWEGTRDGVVQPK